VPHHKRLVERFGDQGLVLIGVHTKGSAEKMPAFVAAERIGYPVCIDAHERTVSTYQVDSYPDYYVIDRMGDLRVADLANAELERVVEALLEEAGPTPATEEGRALAAVEAQGALVLTTEEDGEPRRTSELSYRIGEDADGRFLEQRIDVVLAGATEPVERSVTRVRLAGGLQFESLKTWAGEDLRRATADLALADGKLVGSAGDGVRVLRNVSGKVAAEPLLLLRAAALPFEKGAQQRLAVVCLEKSGVAVRPDARLVYAGRQPQGTDAQGPLRHRVDVFDGRTLERRLWFDERRRLVALDQPSHANVRVFVGAAAPDAQDR
jgi:hypothetical protein